jgi:hypothetical protein
MTQEALTNEEWKDFYQVMNDMILSKVGNKPTKENRFNMDQQEISSLIKLQEEVRQVNQAEMERRKQDPYGARKVIKEILDREMVNHPDHYQGSGGMEVIDIIENYDLGFSLGNAIKYILRSNKKGSAKQDLKKAIWYINREISNLVEEEEDCEDV